MKDGMEPEKDSCAKFETHYVKAYTQTIPLISNTFDAMSMMSINKRRMLSITMNTPNPNSALLVPFSFDDTNRVL